MVMLMMLSPLLATHIPGVAAQETDVPSGNVIVILNDNVQLAETTEIAEDVDATVTFGTVLNGFAADLTPEEAAALADDPNVAGIFPDLPIFLAEEYTSSLGIRRVGAPAASVDLEQGLPSEVDATVAVLDTGVSVSHPNLDVVAGFDAWSAVQDGVGTTDCGALTPEQQATYEGNGATTWGSASNNPHGSVVGGIIGGKGLNAVTGMAPGANIVSVKVWDASGSNSLSKILCGLSWVQANKGTNGIDVVNMSLTWTVTATPCGAAVPDPGHEAICSVVNGGLPIVAANGNAGGPGPMNTYPELIAVTGMNDFDGRPGGITFDEPAGCSSTQGDGTDDFYATYNLPGGADYMAPGTCIRSTTTTGYSNNNTGTSFAAPHVTGAVALYAGSNPSPSDAMARGFLNSVSVPASDPDGIVSGDAAGSLMLRLGPSPVFGTINPTSGAPSAYVNYTITGFPANANVEITWEGIDGEIIDYPSVQTDANGDATGQVQIPDKVPGGPGQLIHFTSGNFVKTFTFETRPRIRFQEPVAAPGSTVLANGRGFAAYDTLTVRWKNELGQYVTIGSVTTNSNGNFTNLALTVPSWAPAGVNTVRMEGVLNQNTSSLTVIVPDVQIVPTRTTVNNWITYDLSNFPPATSISITWTRLSGGTIDMGSVMTDEAGNASGQFRVPATPGGPGQLITVRGQRRQRHGQFEWRRGSNRTRIRASAADWSISRCVGSPGQELHHSLEESGVRSVDHGWVRNALNTGSANIWITVLSSRRMATTRSGRNRLASQPANERRQHQWRFELQSGVGGSTPTPEATPDSTATPEPTEPGTPPTIDTSALPFRSAAS
ncbi:MAG: S8 family serine peptidase [Thermomicrobiales bacterium]